MTERPQKASTLGISDLWAVPALAFKLCSVAEANQIRGPLKQIRTNLTNLTGN
jgi:hypothetical protein